MVRITIPCHTLDTGESVLETNAGLGRESQHAVRTQPPPAWPQHKDFSPPRSTAVAQTALGRAPENVEAAADPEESRATGAP
jgi:hypothetical protein